MTDFELAREIAEGIVKEHQESVMPFSLVEGESGLCDSKAGGLPYLPHDMSWPVDAENRPMILLAQVDCSALKSLPDFPHTGLLQFFIGTDELYGADFDDLTSQKGFRIFYHETVDRSVTEEEVQGKCPKEMEEEEEDTPFETVRSCRICFDAPGRMELTTEDYHFDDFFVEEWNRRRPDAPLEKEFEIHQRLKEEDPDYCWNVFEEEDCDEEEEIARHQIGGYPHFTQNDPRTNLDLGSEDLDVVLFQLDSDFRPDNRGYLVCWGDVGIANFFINREALRKRDFSRVAYHWDCC